MTRQSEVSVLDRHDMEEIVRSGLDPTSGLVISTSVDAHRCLSMIIEARPLTPPPTRSARARARVETNGVDMFVLHLDERFAYRDFDLEPDGQRELLTLLTKLAAAYLAGRGREAEKRGVFGRRDSELALDLDGAAYVFKGERLPRDKRFSQK